MNTGHTIISLEQLVESKKSLAEMFPKPRYFAIIIKAEPGISLSSTAIGNHLLNREAELLPQGCKITRAIEITEGTATKVW